MNFVHMFTDNNSTPSDEATAEQPSRRKLLIGGSALAGALVAQSLRAEQADAHSWLQVEVTPDLDSFDPIREPAEGDALPVGPFHIQGSIYPNGTLNEDGTPPDGAETIGIFRCWGWMYDGGATTANAAVQNIFELDDLGEIHVQGKDFDNKAIIGGTGAFRGASGEMIRESINPDNRSFRATFTE